MLLSFKLFHIRLGQSAVGEGLPISLVKFGILETLLTNELASCVVDANFIINFHSFIQSWRKNMFSIWCPMNAYCALSLSLPYFLKVVEVPNVQLSCKVSKTTNKSKLRERTNSYSVSVALSELKKWIAVFVVKGSHCRLGTWNDDKFLSWVHPDDIMNHSIKNWDKYSQLSSLELNVLTSMFSIVTFSWWIDEILRPNQSCISSGWWFNNYLLSFAALNREFGLLWVR